jgi:hypothetical protein
MAILGASHLQVLLYWRLLDAYKNWRGDLVEVAKIAYRVLAKTTGQSPDRSDCVDAVTVALLGSKRFKGILASHRHLRVSVHVPLAEAMARYLLDQDWTEIIS